jgi:predicted amidohydrolase YtcJ
MKTLDILFVALLPLLVLSCSAPSADIVLKNGEIYTMEDARPWAKSIVIAGNRIMVVLDDNDIDRFVGPETRVIDLGGRLVVPGFIDAHTHFHGFGAQQNDINLMDVTDNDGLIRELRRVVGLLDAGEWITGGQWEAHKIWRTDWREREDLNKNRWEPDRWTIDDVTAENPCLLSSYDRALYLANTAALKAAGLEEGKLEGMKLDGQGKPTGLLYAGSPAIERIRAGVKPKSEARILDELRAGLRVLAQRGITEIHDISSEENMKHYARLHEKGELTARIWGRPHIQKSRDFKERGIRMNTHPVTGEPDPILRWGGYKGYYDGLMGSHGALLFEPYSDRPDTHGTYRRDTSDDPNLLEKNPDKFLGFARIAAEEGFAIDTHAIGSRGISELLDDYQQLADETGRLQRYRVIHAEVVMPKDFARFADLELIAEVNPSQMEDDMRWVKDRLGPEREKLVYPFKTFLDNGVILTFGSDIPGAAGATFSNHPKLAIHAAVRRTNPDGDPPGGWIPEQKISVHQALEAFTINGAYAVFDEKSRGSIIEGKLADLAVCSVNIVKNPKDILNMEIEMTIMDGRIVFEK